jgi:hypothetical protein
MDVIIKVELNGKYVTGAEAEEYRQLCGVLHSGFQPYYEDSDISRGYAQWFLKGLPDDTDLATIKAAIGSVSKRKFDHQKMANGYMIRAGLLDQSGGTN